MVRWAGLGLALLVLAVAHTALTPAAGADGSGLLGDTVNTVAAATGAMTPPAASATNATQQTAQAASTTVAQAAAPVAATTQQAAPPVAQTAQNATAPTASAVQSAAAAAAPTVQTAAGAVAPVAQTVQPAASNATAAIAPIAQATQPVIAGAASAAAPLMQPFVGATESATQPLTGVLAPLTPLTDSIQPLGTAVPPLTHLIADSVAPLTGPLTGALTPPDTQPGGTVPRSAAAVTSPPQAASFAVPAADAIRSQPATARPATSSAMAGLVAAPRPGDLAPAAPFAPPDRSRATSTSADTISTPTQATAETAPDAISEPSGTPSVAVGRGAESLPVEAARPVTVSGESAAIAMAAAATERGIPSEGSAWTLPTPGHRASPGTEGARVTPPSTSEPPPGAVVPQTLARDLIRTLVAPATGSLGALGGGSAAGSFAAYLAALWLAALGFYSQLRLYRSMSRPPSMVYAPPVPPA